MAKVIQHVAGKANGRLLFEGLKEDAEEFIRNNFPRHHIEPGTRNEDAPVADASLVDDDDNETSYIGGKFVASDKGAATAEDDDDDDDGGEHSATVTPKVIDKPVV